MCVAPKKAIENKDVKSKVAAKKYAAKLAYSHLWLLLLMSFMQADTCGTLHVYHAYFLFKICSCR